MPSAIPNINPSSIASSTRLGSSYMMDDASFWTARDSVYSVHGIDPLSVGSRMSDASADSANTIRISRSDVFAVGSSVDGRMQVDGADGATHADYGQRQREANVEGQEKCEDEMWRGEADPKLVPLPDSWSRLGGANHTYHTISEHTEDETAANENKPDCKTSGCRKDSAHAGTEQEEEVADEEAERDLQVTIQPRHAARIKHVLLAFDAPSPSSTPNPFQHPVVDSDFSATPPDTAASHSHASEGTTTSTTTYTTDETPFPSRILHLFPHLSTIGPSPMKTQLLPASMSINFMQLREQLNDVCGGGGGGGGGSGGGDMGVAVAGGRTVGIQAEGMTIAGAGWMGGVQLSLGLVQHITKAVRDGVTGLVAPSWSGVGIGLRNLSDVVESIRTLRTVSLPHLSSLPFSLGSLQQSLVAHFLALTGSSLPAITLALDNTPLAPAYGHPTVRAPREHLYAQETIYTLRMPVSEHGVGKLGTQYDGAGLDIGPTVRPVFVKKRSAMPDFDTRGGAGGVGVGVGVGVGARGREARWGREVEWKLRR